MRAFDGGILLSTSTARYGRRSANFDAARAFEVGTAELALRRLTGLR